MAKLISGILTLIVGIILTIAGNSINSDPSTQLVSLLSGKGSNPGMPLIIIGVILIVIGVILLVAYFMGKRKAK